jgi:hypothetical protein
MVKLHSAMLAGAAMLSFGGSALAQSPEWRTMAVDLPNGSTAQIRYAGEVPPQVTVAMVTPQDQRDRDFYECYDAYGYFGHYSPCFRHGGDHARHAARRVIQAPSSNAVGLQAMPQQFVVPAGSPRGSRYHYMLISTAPNGQVCTQRTEFLSRGPDKEPLVTRTDSEGCAAISAPPPAVEATPKPTN